MISTIYNGTTGEVTNKSGERIKKSTSVIQYSNLMKGVDKADQYLSCLTILKKHKMDQNCSALAQQLSIIQFLSSAQVCRTEDQD
jgi:hypothetical protein